MMIVNERPMYAVVAAIAWLMLLHLWQDGTSEPRRAGADASQASHVAALDAAPTAGAAPKGHR